MKPGKEIDISDVRINPVRVGESDLEAEVTTPYGVARVTMDLSSDDVVGVRAVLPSGNQYQSVVDSWASDTVGHETDQGISSTLRLAVDFIIQCFEKEAARAN
jgi:hypothetical protein